LVVAIKQPPAARVLVAIASIIARRRNGPTRPSSDSAAKQAGAQGRSSRLKLSSSAAWPPT